MVLNVKGVCLWVRNSEENIFFVKTMKGQVSGAGVVSMAEWQLWSYSWLPYRHKFWKSSFPRKLGGSYFAQILHWGFVILMIKVLKELEPCEVLFKMPFIEAKEREDMVGNIAALQVLGMSHQKALNGSPFRAQLVVLSPHMYILAFWSHIFFPNTDWTFFFFLYNCAFVYIHCKKKFFKFFFWWMCMWKHNVYI